MIIYNFTILELEQLRRFQQAACDELCAQT